jgi:alpha-N-acetylglucosamine transferase
MDPYRQSPLFREHKMPVTPYKLSRPSSRKYFRSVGTATLWVILIYSLYQILLSKLPPRHNSHYGLLNSTTKTSKFAIATFLDEDLIHAEEDKYFVATRMLTYQLLHANKTKIPESMRAEIDWLVLVPEEVDQEKRAQLEKEGATIVVVENVKLSWWIKTGITRWAHQFQKLALLQMIKYDRILFIDADTILQDRMDTIFVEGDAVMPAKTDPRRGRADEAMLPSDYVFLARPDNQYLGERDHAVPPINTTNSISAGFWLVAPSQELSHHLMSITKHPYRFDSTTMEQSLFNYAFRKDGPMPWKELDWRWSATWPSEKDKSAGVKSLHEKLWKTGPEDLKQDWIDLRDEMERYWSAG